MFNFSANHLLLLSRMEYRSCVVFLMKDDSTRRVYRLYDFTKSQWEREHREERNLRRRKTTLDVFPARSGKVTTSDPSPVQPLVPTVNLVPMLFVGFMLLAVLLFAGRR